MYNLHSASTAPPLEKFVDTFRPHGIITKCYQMHHIHMVLKIHIIKSYFVQGEFLLWPLLKLPGIRKFFYGMWLCDTNRNRQWRMNFRIAPCKICFFDDKFWVLFKLLYVLIEERLDGKIETMLNDGKNFSFVSLDSSRPL